MPFSLLHARLRTMPKVREENAVTVVELERVFVDQAERMFREELATVAKNHKRQVKELMYLTYETMLRGKFGEGPFNVAISCSDTEFVVGVKKEA